MFREMRKKDKELAMEENMEILNKCDYGVLSTISSNGYPYITPLNYVYHGNSIYFHSATEGHKLDNIKECNKVCFCVTDSIEILREDFDTNYRSVVVYGTAKEIFEEEKEKALFDFIEKYSKDFAEEGKKYIEKASRATRVYKIQADHITGKAQK